MISRADILEWQNLVAPWPSSQLVEHDLILSRAICELYQNPIIQEQLAFRGGTALHKLFFQQAGRFSEDLDFVQIQAKPIGQIVEAIRNCLDNWLGKPTWKQNQGRFVLYYRFETDFQPVISRKVKIEINTREHFNVHPHNTKLYEVRSAWFTGQAQVITYSLEELLGTKLRALYQRKKGRDLYDLWYAVNYIKNLDKVATVNAFHHYMNSEGKQISRAEFERNLFIKQSDKIFNNDISPLLSTEQAKLYQSEDGHKILQDFIINMRGGPWKGVITQSFL